MLEKSITLQFLIKPLTTGAVCPSSRALAGEITSGIGLEQASSIAELGPGTGALTASIIEKKGPGAKFFTVELNESMVKAFQEKFPDVTVYFDSASNLPSMLGKEKIASLDAIISGLPWASFPGSLQDELLSAIRDSLAPGGYFATFAYLQGTVLPRGIEFKKRLSRYFSSVEKSKIVWMNFPPAFVYRCKK